MTRGGFTLVELIVAGVVLGAVMTLTMQLLAAVTRQHQEAQRRQLAMIELENVLERITAGNFEQVTAEVMAEIHPSDEIARRLPSCELSVSLHEPGGPPAAKRITVSMRWLNRQGQFVAPVRLVTWVYGSAEEAQQ